ncbi:glycosyl transferase family group 2-domain-containing protein [Ampelomyces quisqualis]|uniref:Glycosyl transferase family group 2-domain-containing protein n=1 Tax=Ampelomyces quisqualis TaxID=50730 RepID=A0A6A5QSM4_AMPQU|nr:glycosyl transferase family group 2-domain-containing protein [Ampelomyces quisqualis]
MDRIREPPRGNSRSSVHSASPSTASDAIRDIKCEILANWLYAKAEEKLWINDEPGEGVFVKKTKGNYAHYPPDLKTDGTDIYDAITALNVRCATTVSTKMIRLILSRTELPYVQIQHGMRLQVVPDFSTLRYCQKNQSASFIASEQLLVVWEDDPRRLLDRAQGIQDALVKMIWGNELSRLTDSTVAKSVGIDVSEPDDGLEEYDETPEEPRKIRLWQAVYTGIAITVLTVGVGSGWSHIAIEQIQDPNWLRMLFILAVPGQAWLAFFFFQAIVGNVAQIFGPLNPVKTNSKYYSARPPKRLHRDVYGQLPHVTIQMPVYKEGLHGVIKPTVQSVKHAISTYELQGGTANIFINDDGMQVICHEDAKERREFYEENGIGWVARPKHNPTPANGEKQFVRRGKFKKASNMNYALRLSVQIEEMLNSITRTETWSQMEENKAYERALAEVLAAREGEAWADGSIRVGDYILLIDSDTRVPQDCLLEAVSEMEQCPEVAILQYISGVMNVTNTFFENGITFFTNMIYTMIKFAVANGDVAPFVGHNAILRWKAIQGVAYHCETDFWEKYWSESTVSEDFDMSLRLLCDGYTVRLAAYKGDGFKEGVSLTVYDELNRWEKYAYGCNEMIFHPLRDWLFKGPLTRLFIVFLTSSIPLPSKITIMAYIGTYYAIGSLWIFTTLNYFLVGFFNGWLDHYYMGSFKVYVAIVFIFTIVGNVSLGVLRHRIEDRNPLYSLLENFKWIPMLTIFLGGISLHVSQALLSHFFSIDMEWGSTSKEVEDVPFPEAMRAVARKFRWTFAFCGLMTAVMVVCAYAIQHDWQIRTLIACWPMGNLLVTHALLPIVLNPQLMTFTW